MTWPTACSPTTGSAASTTRRSAPAWRGWSGCSSPSRSAAACSGWYVGVAPRPWAPGAATGTPHRPRRSRRGRRARHAPAVPAGRVAGPPAAPRGEDRGGGGVDRGGRELPPGGVLGLRGVRRPGGGGRHHRPDPTRLARRATIELPFVALAFALPFLAAGERVSVAGLSLSVEGLLGGWNILAQATLGVLASLLMVGTTTVRDLILGLDRLRCPSALTQIATFMLRYLDVLAAEARRMRVARLSRGDDPRFLWQLRGFAVGMGALFLRAYE